MVRDEVPGQLGGDVACRRRRGDQVPDDGPCLRFTAFERRPTGAYDGLLLQLAGGEAQVAELIARKRPSTGLVALALGLTEAGFSHAILAGFDFTLAHAYGHNPLIRAGYRGAIGLKTGYTDEAGRCFVGVARRSGRTLGVVLLNSSNPLKHATALLDRGFRAEGPR